MFSDINDFRENSFFLIFDYVPEKLFTVFGLT
jgi:hypothetical protein